MTRTSLAQLLALLEGFDVHDEQARRSVRHTVALLRTAPDPFDRAHYHPGHITASAAVLSPDGANVLLVYHPRLKRWLQPGGHVEPGDRSLLDTARREVLEEAGLDLPPAPPRLVGVDVHRIPADRGEPEHLHHDLMFCLRAAARGPHTGRHRTIWCPLGELARYATDGALRRAVSRARTLTRASRDPCC